MPRIKGKWEKVSNDIMSQLLTCNITRGRRYVLNANTMVMVVIADQREYQNCINDIINDLEGHLYKYERVDIKRMLGNEYRYIIIFTEEPEKAQTVILFTGWDEE